MMIYIVLIRSAIIVKCGFEPVTASDTNLLLVHATISFSFPSPSLPPSLSLSLLSLSLSPLSLSLSLSLFVYAICRVSTPSDVSRYSNYWSHHISVLLQHVYSFGVSLMIVRGNIPLLLTGALTQRLEQHLCILTVITTLLFLFSPFILPLSLSLSLLLLT